jgi:hypothetical protein
MFAKKNQSQKIMKRNASTKTLEFVRGREGPLVNADRLTKPAADVLAIPSRYLNQRPNES